MRILITGAPRTGKTTYASRIASELNLGHLCTDPQSYCPEGVVGTEEALGWSERSQWIADNWLNKDNVVIEGVAIPRALRKLNNVEYDKLIILIQPFQELTPKQAAMGKSVHDVIKELGLWDDQRTIKIYSSMDFPSLKDLST